MGTREEEIAKKVASQSKVKKRVIGRRILTNGILPGVIALGIGVASTLGLIHGFEIEQNMQTQKVAEHQASINYNYNNELISQEELEQANIEYYEEIYGAESIYNEQKSIINEYGVLINSIVENEKLRNNDNVKPLDSNRFDNVMNDFNNFKKTIDEDQNDYYNATEEERLVEAGYLYNIKEDVLQKELIEAVQKGKYLTPNTKEYNDHQERIVELNRKINTIRMTRDIIMERMITIDSGKQR